LHPVAVLFLAAAATTRLPAEEGASRPTAVPTPAQRRGLDRRTEEDLRKELLRVPEVDLDQDATRRTSTWLVNLAVTKSEAKYHRGRASLLQDRRELAGLPLQSGPGCRLDENTAQDFELRSRDLRACQGDERRLRGKLLEGADRSWLEPGAVPCLVQLLQAEPGDVRGLLVEVLARIPGQAASQALARRALFDLAPAVRAKALWALADRPPREFRGVLVEGLRYPWLPVAEHAAEALVALQDREAVPLLTALWREPNPAVLAAPAKGGTPTARDLVRVNHLRNCLLCHAGSRYPDDRVRGRIPDPREELPPESSTEYYEASRGLFARADITYLRQDFSVRQPVAAPGKWPDRQRYDYVLKTRPADREDLDRRSGAGHHKAILFALEGLGGDRRRLQPAPPEPSP
jgi:hypothetical protein